MTKSDRLARILDSPRLPHIVPRLPPERLLQVVQRYGLADAAGLLALATPEQLGHVFDLDLWRPAVPGRDEEFDAGRFGEWIEALVDFDVSVAADKLLAIDLELVITGLAEHVAVFDGAAGIGGVDAHVGGYAIRAKRADAWEAIVALLQFLEAERPGKFHHVMSGCRALSNAGFETDGLDGLLGSSAQAMFDLAVAREQRREAHGFLSPAQGRAFLQASRNVDLRGEAPPAPDPIARAYFLAMSAAPPDAIARVDPNAAAERTEDGAFLANAILAGCSYRGRSFAPQEAADAAIAVCRLGLENWPAHWPRASARDLVNVFEVGWTILHGLSMEVAAGLAEVLGQMLHTDSWIQRELRALGRSLKKHSKDQEPWHAQDGLEMIAALDSVSWAGLTGLIAECPVMHAALAAPAGARTLSINATDFAFISSNEQIAAVRQFMQSLPERLGS